MRKSSNNLILRQAVEMLICTFISNTFNKFHVLGTEKKIKN